MNALHIPVLRFGRPYRSLEQAELFAPDGSLVATVSQANAGLIQRDRKKLREARAELAALTTQQLFAICKDAAERFLRGTLPIGDANPGGSGSDGLGGPMTLSPDDYVARLSSTSGLPHALCRRNMEKIHAMLARMEEVLGGLTRGLPLSVLDEGTGEQAGILLGYRAVTDALGVILPSNSPGVNSLWLPAVALRIPVVLKPGRGDPFTPSRIAQALFAAGLPAAAISIYPTDHAGAAAVLEGCGRSLLFGDAHTIARHATDPRIEVHGPGYSKVIVGDDFAAQVASSPALLDVLVASIADNGGRSCVNASTIIVPAHGDAIAEALAARLAALVPRAAGDPRAQLAAFTDASLAARINAAVEQGLRVPGASDITARHREGGRLVTAFGATWLQPTLVRCASFEHPLAQRELLFPYAAVVEMPAREMAARIGPSLVVTALTREPHLIAAMQQSPTIERLNLGPTPTSQVRWDQPHEGNLFELLFRRRAVQYAAFPEAAIPKKPVRVSPSTIDRFVLDRDGFDAAAHVRLVHGLDRAERTGALARGLGITRVLLVTDAGLVAAGHAARIERSLVDAGIVTTVFGAVRPDPDTTDVDACLAAARASTIEAFVALGGGSAIDTAKGANFLLTNGGRMADYRGHGKATRPLLPLIAIPTTAGTGSECQSYALIGDGKTGFKMACGDPSALPRIAILDPSLTLSQPRSVTATAGIDTLVHAVETTVTRARSAYAVMHAREAFGLASAALPVVLEHPDDLGARARMQLAAAFAGIAIEHSMLGASHAAANPLSARYHAPHGQAVGRMLTSVVLYNAADPGARAAYAALARAAGLLPEGHDGDSDGDAAALAALVAQLTSLVQLAGVPSLAALGVDEAAIPSLAREAAAQWTAAFNPRAVDASAFELLYRSSLAGS